MRVYILALLSAAILGCQGGAQLGPGDENRLASAAQSDCGFVQNLYGERVSWKKNIPVTLKISASYPPEFKQVLSSAAQHWNDAAGMTLLRLVDNPSDDSKAPSQNATNSVHWLHDWEDSQKKIQALTDLSWRGNQLIEADVRVNAHNFNFFTSKATTPYDIHLESLLIHELGHVLGLKHRSTVPSVMWAVLNGASVRATLSAADKESLKCEY